MKKFWENIWPLLFLLGLLAFTGIYCANHAFKFAQRSAVQQGHAEYYLDDYNNRQWRWLPKGDEK